MEIKEAVGSYLIGTGIVTFASSFMTSILTPLINKTFIGRLGGYEYGGLKYGEFLAAFLQLIIILIIGWILVQV